MPTSVRVAREPARRVERERGSIVELAAVRLPLVGRDGLREHGLVDVNDDLIAIGGGTRIAIAAMLEEALGHERERIGPACGRGLLALEARNVSAEASASPRSLARSSSTAASSALRTSAPTSGGSRPCTTSMPASSKK